MAGIYTSGTAASIHRKIIAGGADPKDSSKIEPFPKQMRLANE